MPERTTYREECVPANSLEQEHVITKLTAQGWQLVACAVDADAPGDVLLTFRRTEDTTTASIQ
jgi:hypothetical protein